MHIVVCERQGGTKTEEARKAQGHRNTKCRHRKQSKNNKRKGGKSCLQKAKQEETEERGEVLPAAERELCPWLPLLCCSPPAGSPNALTPSGGCSSLRRPDSALGASPRRPALSPEHCLVRACLLQDHLRPLHASGQSHVCSNTFCILVGTSPLGTLEWLREMSVPLHVLCPCEDSVSLCRVCVSKAV